MQDFRGGGGVSLLKFLKFLTVVALFQTCAVSKRIKREKSAFLMNNNFNFQPKPNVIARAFCYDQSCGAITFILSHAR